MFVLTNISTNIYHRNIYSHKKTEEKLVLTRATWHNIPEDGILHSHCCENLKFYNIFVNLFMLDGNNTGRRRWN
jgi:predicted nuclease of restriction endonuclease-like (RecB) superfamily